MGMDVYGKSGNYFRANIWSWRPIHKLCETVLARKLNWGFNDGAGFQSQADCNLLADKLEAYLQKNPHESIELESSLRIDERGVFKRDMPIDQGQSLYSTNHEHVLEFVKFLRECGGSFEIL